MHIIKPLLLALFFLLQGPLPISAQEDNAPRLMIQKGHNEGIRKVRFTPDGKMLLSLGYDGVIKLWDVESVRFLYDIEYKKKFDSFAVSPDGSLLATSQNKGTFYDYVTGASIIKLWSLKTLQLINEFAATSLEMAFSPDGKTIATGGTNIAVFDVKTASKKFLINFPGGLITHLVFSNDGDSIISSTNLGTINRSKVSSGELIKTIREDQQGINSFALSPDGTFLFYASSTSTTLRKLDSGELVFAKETEKYKPFFNSGQLNYVMDVAFSPDGKYLATAHDGGNLNILDSKTGALLHKIQTH